MSAQEVSKLAIAKHTWAAYLIHAPREAKAIKLGGTGAGAVNAWLKEHGDNCLPAAVRVAVLEAMVQDPLLSAHREVLLAVSDAGLPISPSELLRFVSLHTSMGTLLVAEAKKKREEKLFGSASPEPLLLRTSPQRPPDIKEIKRRLGVGGTSPPTGGEAQGIASTTDMMSGTMSGPAEALSERPLHEAAEAKKAATKRREELERRIALHRILHPRMEQARLAMGRAVWAWGRHMHQAAVKKLKKVSVCMTHSPINMHALLISLRCVTGIIC